MFDNFWKPNPSEISTPELDKHAKISNHAAHFVLDSSGRVVSNFSVDDNSVQITEEQKLEKFIQNLN